MNIILIGFKGVGKTTLGRILAEQLEYDFIDTDLLLLKKYNMTCITELYKYLGEKEFRQAEQNVINDISCTKTVIATGGGAYINKVNRIKLHTLGHVINLEISLLTALTRVTIPCSMLSIIKRYLIYKINADYNHKTIYPHNQTKTT